MNENELRLLAEEAKQAKERARRRAFAIAQQANPNSGNPTKENITPEEYVSRRDKMLRRDMSLVQEVKRERIAQSSADWQKKVGKTFAGATVDNPRIAERVARIGDEYGSHKTSLVFYGTMGAGKSWHCYSYINMAIAAGKVTAGQIVMGTETDVLGRIASGGYKRNDMLEELTHPRHKIYFIDDIGQGYFSREESRTEVWYELIDHVYTHQLTLLLTTNLSVTENGGLQRWVGKRGFDRLRNIVGSDGMIEPGKVNRREAIAAENDARYRNNRPQRRIKNIG